MHTLAASGIPDATQDSSRWTGPFRIDRRFGTSGAAAFLLRLGRAGEGATDHELARTLVDDLLRKSRLSQAGRHWVLPRYGFQGAPGQNAAYTGYFYGAAGLGLTLLDMHYAEADRRAAITLPDDPFHSDAR